MKNKAIIPLVLAVVLGLLTFVVGRKVLSARMNSINPVSVAQSTSKVIVAAAELPVGHMLRAEDVKLASAGAEAVTPTMFTTSESLEGRMLATPVESGQIIRESLLSPEGTSSGLQAKVPAGMRAVTIAVNEFSGLAGMIEPGVRVDLIATLNDNLTGETFARAVVQNVLVSAVGQQLEAGKRDVDPKTGGARSTRTVTLLVTPSQAAAIDLAFAKSKPRLVLRSTDDELPVTDPGVTLAELAGRATNDRLMDVTGSAYPEENPKVMEMLAGLKQQMEDFGRASREAAEQAALDAARQAADSEETDLPSLRTVRVFRGGASEMTQQFDADGRPVGAGSVAAPRPQQPRATSGRERERVSNPAGSPSGEATQAAADTKQAGK